MVPAKPLPLLVAVTSTSSPAANSSGLTVPQGAEWLVDYEAGRGVTFALGALRPALGAVFGIAFYAAVVSGLLDLFNVPAAGDTKQFYFFLVIAFLAGFSERWARDVLVERRPRAVDLAGTADALQHPFADLGQVFDALLELLLHLLHRRGMGGVGD